MRGWKTRQRDRASSRSDMSRRRVDFLRGKQLQSIVARSSSHWSDLKAKGHDCGSGTTCMYTVSYMYFTCGSGDFSRTGS